MPPKFYEETDVSPAFKKRLAKLKPDYVKAELVVVDENDDAGILEILYLYVCGSMGTSLLTSMSDDEIYAVLSRAAKVKQEPVEFEVSRGKETQAWKPPFDASDVVAYVQWASGPGVLSKKV